MDVDVRPAKLNKPRDTRGREEVEGLLPREPEGPALPAHGRKLLARRPADREEGRAASGRLDEPLQDPAL
eukprot:437366-Alexandrium_andersonii.AAC.1